MVSSRIMWRVVGRRPRMAAVLVSLAMAGCRTPPATPIAAPSVVPAPAPVGAVPPAAPEPVLLSPADLDVLVEQIWRDAGVTVAAPADDSEFLRRVTLDVAGRAPSLDDVRTFLASRDPGKRVRLVDDLLASADYAEHWADVYLDLFVGRQFRKPKLEKQLDPRSYFVAAFRENRPYDQIARELLTFTGEILPNGPGVFLASHLKGGGPEMAASVTARLFLGVQIQCAQCHDHPYDPRYKQDDFYGLVAYFARTKDRQQRRDQQMNANESPSNPVDGGQGDPSAATMPNRMLPSATPDAKPDQDKIYLVIDKPRGQAKFKRVGTEVETVAPPKFVGRVIPPLPDETPRQTLARAVVGSDLFTKTLVDRTWAQLFGRAILDPWDDLGGEQDPRHPPLLNRLSDDFRASGFDLKHLIRTILLSRAYGLTSRKALAASPDGAAPVAKDDGAVFARAAVRRLTPEQLFRSLMVATGADHMDSASAADMDKKITRLLRECLFVFADDEMAEVNTFNGNIPQALLLWNGEIVNQGARAKSGGTLARILDESADPEVRLRQIFLAAYARPFTDAERARLLPRFTPPNTPRTAYEDLFFAMLTSSEMLTVH